MSKESDDDLLPLSRPEKLGLPFKRRVLGRRIVDGTFPQPVRINGRLFIPRGKLREYLQRLQAEGVRAPAVSVPKNRAMPSP